jgi:hypothetical protein
MPTDPADLSPSHRLTRQLKVRLDPDILAAYSTAVEIAGTTKKDPIQQFCEKFARDQGVKIPRACNKSLPK